MNMIIRTKPAQVTDDLTTKAMLVRISAHRWHAKVADVAAGNEVAERKKSKEAAVKLTKTLLQSESYDLYKRASWEAIRRHKELTLPWDEGVGLLPAKLFFKYNEEIEKIIRKADECADKFTEEYRAQWNA